MLQNPSKYHTNPLSHFLALHNSQATHNGIGVTSVSNVQPHTAVAAAAAAAAAVAATGQSSYHNASSVLANQQQHQQHPHHQHHHQQQHNQQQNAHNRQQQQHAHTQSHQQAAATAVAVAAHQHHLQQQSSATSHAHVIDTAHTPLDVGKSFTIAAILGLQKSAIEHQRKEYNNAINLSLNGGSCGGISSDEDIKKHTNLNNNNNDIISNNNTSHNSIKVFANNSFGNSVNNFNCDSSNSGIGSIALVNRYLPSAPNNGNVAASFVAHHHHQQQQQQQQQHQQQQQNVRANTFAAAAAVAAAAAASAAPSALQSLQQLHQQHAQQATLSFQREKLKAETSKKNSLKNKRVRTIFTPEQLERLEAEFERQQYMVGPERLYLAHTLQLTEAQVKVWFQNRRIKWRKHHLEITQQRLALIRQSQLPSAGANVGGDSGHTLATLAATTTTSSITAASTPSIEDNEDSKHDVDLHPLSGAGSESDLSICNDSLDGDSIIDGNGEDT